MKTLIGNILLKRIKRMDNMFKTLDADDFHELRFCVRCLWPLSSVTTLPLCSSRAVCILLSSLSLLIFFLLLLIIYYGSTYLVMYTVIHESGHQLDAKSDGGVWLTG